MIFLCAMRMRGVLKWEDKAKRFKPFANELSKDVCKQQDLRRSRSLLYCMQPPLPPKKEEKIIRIYDL